MIINYYSTWHDAPKYGSQQSAAFDLKARLINDYGIATPLKCKCNANLSYESRANGKNDSVFIEPKHRVLVPTGIFTDPQTQDCIFFLVALRSSAGWEKGLQIPNAIGVIDMDYRGEWHLILFNPTDVNVEIQHGERLGQAILIPFIKADFNRVNSMAELSNSERGIGGFGSTGK